MRKRKNVIRLGVTEKKMAWDTGEKVKGFYTVYICKGIQAKRLQ
jgi:hypothetical protein